MNTVELVAKIPIQQRILGVIRVGGLGALMAGMVDRIRLFTGLNYFFSAINLLLVISLLWWSNLLRTGETKSIGSMSSW